MCVEYSFGVRTQLRWKLQWRHRYPRLSSVGSVFEKRHPIFSRKSDYGLRALIYLAEHREAGPITLQEIADSLLIPKAFLSKILQQLARNHIVRSLKGPSGGFVLTRDPAELTMREIVFEIDGPLRVFECFSESRDCSYFGNCKILSVFDEVGRQVERVLGNVTLAQFLPEHRPMTHAVPERAKP